VRPGSASSKCHDPRPARAPHPRCRSHRRRRYDRDRWKPVGPGAVPGRPGAPADLFPLHHPERTDLIEGSIGELSPFHQTLGYYAHGVSEETAILPQGWKERLVVIRNENTRGAKGLCLEVHDLLVSKLIAGREKDFDYLKNAAKHRMADPEELLRRLATVKTAPEIREKARAAIEGAFRGGAA
jgi:hypothetical protein